MQINIMVEGYDDQELVTALLIKLGKVEQWQEAGKTFRGTTAIGSLVAVYEMGGWTNLPTDKVRPLLQQGPEVDVRNLVIYDADTSSHDHGGFMGRRAELQRQATTLGLMFDLFLFPTNNADGNLEDLLESLIHPDHQQVVGCFANYETCMHNCIGPTGLPYRLPANKAKFYAYVEAMPLSDDERKAHKSRGATKYFANPNYWNLEADDIQPLRNFLDRYIQ